MCKPQAISMTTSAMPALVRRKTSLTIRHRLIPAMTFSTTTRALEKRPLSIRAPMLNSWPLGFFWLGRQYACRLIALEAGILIKRGVDRGSDRGLVSGFLVVHAAGKGRSEIPHFVGVCVHQEDVLVRVGLFLAAVMFFVLRGVGGPLPAPLRAVHGQCGCALQGQRVVGHLACLTLRRLPHIPQGVLQHRP